MKDIFGKMFHDRRGATSVEYGFIAALIVVALMAALIAFAGASVELWDNVADKVVNA